MADAVVLSRAVTPPALDSNRIPCRTSNAAWREIQGETILLDTKGRVMRGLNVTGGAAWRLADGTRTVAAIGRSIAESTGANVAQVVADVTAFFQELRDAGVIELREPE